MGKGNEHWLAGKIDKSVIFSMGKIWAQQYDREVLAYGIVVAGF